MVDRSDLVRAVRNSRAWDFRTREELARYNNAVVVALHAADPNWGHLSKSEAQNHSVDPLGRRHAVDAALYKANGQIVDFIGSAGFDPDNPPPNPVAWSVGPEGEYGQDRWFSPVPFDEEPIFDDDDNGGDTPDIDVAEVKAFMVAVTHGMAAQQAWNVEIEKQIGMVNEQYKELVNRPQPPQAGLKDHRHRIGSGRFSVVTGGPET